MCTGVYIVVVNSWESCLDMSGALWVGQSREEVTSSSLSGAGIWTVTAVVFWRHRPLCLGRPVDSRLVIYGL